ncbi:MAG: hypothetical protein U0401_22140 [Anaerolineae bacterium]
MLKNLSFAALILTVLFMLSACGSTATPLGQAATEEATPTPPPTRAPADERAKGDLNAPVTLIEYGDYQ